MADSQRLLKGSASLIALDLENDVGDPAASTTAVTVGVTRAGGAVAVAAGAATTNPSTGRYEMRLPIAAQASADLLTATWSVTLDGQAQTRTTTAEIVGGFLFSLRQLRAMPGCGDTTAYTTADLEVARARAESYVETRVGAALVARYGTETIARTDRYDYGAIPVRPYVRRVLSLTIDGVAFVANPLAAMVIADWGEISRPAGYFGTGRVVIAYEHGYVDTPPPELARAALIRARHDLLGWTSDQPGHPVDVDQLGTTDPAQANADMMAGRTQVDEAIKIWRPIIRCPVFA